MTDHDSAQKALLANDKLWTKPKPILKRTNTDIELDKEPREVEFAITITKLEAVDELKMNFTITFYMQLRWLIKKSEKDDDFVPYLEWMNGEPTGEKDWSSSIQILDENLTEDRNLSRKWRGRKTARRTMRGCFSEPLELAYFPFDYQKLHVYIRSDMVENIRFTGLREPIGKLDAALVEYVGDNKRESEGISGKQWTLVHWSPMQSIAGEYVDVDFTESNKERSIAKSANKDSYAEIVVRLYLRRLFMNYLLNVYIPAFGITFLSLSQFFVHLDQSLAERQSITLALLLSMVALKFSVSSELPKIPYATRLDLYLLFCIAFIMLACGETLFVIQYDHCKDFGEYNPESHNRQPTCTIDDVLFYVFVGVFVTFNVFVVLEIAFRARMISSKMWTVVGYDWGWGRRSFDNAPDMKSPEDTKPPENIRK